MLSPCGLVVPLCTVQARCARMCTLAVIATLQKSQQHRCLQGKHGLLDHLKDDAVEPAPEGTSEGIAEHDGTSAAETALSPGAEFIAGTAECFFTLRSALALPTRAP